MVQLSRMDWVNDLRDDAMWAGKLGRSIRDQIADLLESDYLAPETLAHLAALAENERRYGHNVAGMIDNLISRLTTPPVVQWTDVGDGAIAACGGWTLTTAPSCHSKEGWVVWLTRPDRVGHIEKTGPFDTLATGKRMAEAKLAELMRGA